MWKKRVQWDQKEDRWCEKHFYPCFIRSSKSQNPNSHHSAHKFNTVWTACNLLQYTVWADSLQRNQHTNRKWSNVFLNVQYVFSGFPRAASSPPIFHHVFHLRVAPSFTLATELREICVHQAQKFTQHEYDVSGIEAICHFIDALTKTIQFGSKYAAHFHVAPLFPLVFSTRVYSKYLELRKRTLDLKCF